MALMRAGHPVRFIDIEARKSKGKSHINPIRDGLRFMIIIFKIATLHAPLKLFGCQCRFFLVSHNKGRDL